MYSTVNSKNKDKGEIDFGEILGPIGYGQYLYSLQLKSLPVSTVFPGQEAATRTK